MPFSALSFLVLLVLAITTDVAGHMTNKEHAGRLASTGHKISAYFVTPDETQAQNELLLLRMRADAITFGYTLMPADTNSLPKELRPLIKSRRSFFYEGVLEWPERALRKTDRQVRVQGAMWTVLDIDSRSAVVFRGGRDPVKALNAAGNRLGAKTIVGLPVPVKSANLDTPYLPDTSYLDVVQKFTERFVEKAAAEGADGYYQATEMPATDTSAWSGVRKLYAMQNLAVNHSHKGALVIISPYLESRQSKSHFTPRQAARGAQMLLRTAHGVKLVIAPQDGLGTGSTALRDDASSGRVAPLEDYLAAMQSSVGPRLWTNVELMRPGIENLRRVTTRARVEQQLRTEERFTRKAIAFIWHDNTRKIGAVRVRDGMTGLSRGLGHTQA